MTPSPVVLVILDGWGLAAAGPERRRARGDARLRRAPGAVSARHARRVGRSRRVFRQGRWGTRRSVTSRSARAGSCSRISRASTTRSRTDPSDATRRSARRSHGPGSRRGCPSARARLVRRCPLASRPPPRAPHARRGRGYGRAGVDPLLHGRARRLPARSSPGSRRAVGHADRDRMRSLLRDGQGQPLGANGSRGRCDPLRRGRARDRSRRGGSREL